MEIRNGWIFADENKVVTRGDKLYHIRCSLLANETLANFEEITIDEMNARLLENNELILRENYENEVISELRKKYSEIEVNTIKNNGLDACMTFMSGKDIIAVEQKYIDDYRTFKCYVDECKCVAHKTIYE